MKIRFFETSRGRVGVVVDSGSIANLQARHFRGRGVHKAGNFARWSNPAEFLDDGRFRIDILPVLLVAREESRRTTVSVEVEIDEFVGWTAATDHDDPAWLYRHNVQDKDGIIHEVADNDVQVMPQSLEWRRLRHGVKAEFVVDGSLAPMTPKVTVIARLKARDWGTLIVIYSIRPGMVMPDFMVGRHGDIEVDESYGLMFWDWECDGDNPHDPDYYYGRHVDEPRLDLLTGESALDWWDDIDDD